jgi:hypothetical protein
MSASSGRSAVREHPPRPPQPGRAYRDEPPLTRDIADLLAVQAVPVEDERGSGPGSFG